MKTEHAKTENPTVAARLLANTVWGIGTSMWAGLALPGKVLTRR